MEITEAQFEALERALRGGNDLETSCHYAGVSVPLVYRWFERGKIEAEAIAVGADANPDESKYLDFWEKLKKARADAIVRNVANIQQAAQNGDWRASAWWLEKGHPDVYATRPQRQQSEVTSAGQQPKSIQE